MKVNPIAESDQTEVATSSNSVSFVQKENTRLTHTSEELHEKLETSPESTEATDKTSQHESTLKKVLVEWSLLTKFDCYSKIFEYENRVAKILWTLLFACFTALTACLVVKCVMDFAKFEVVTTIRIVNERPTDYPTVTICNNNAFTSRKAQHLIEQVATDQYDVDFSNLTSMEFYARYPIENVTELAKMYVARPDYGDENRGFLGFPAYDILSCKYAGKDCLDNDLVPFYSYDYGNCWQFNATGKNVIVAGKDFGLSMMLMLINRNKYPTTQSDGFVVFIHNSSYEPSFGDGVYLMTGQETNVAVRRTFSYNEPQPYTDCIGANFYINNR